MATVPARISLADHGRRMTLEEFREADAEEGYRYELGRGILEVSDNYDDGHGMVVYNLMRGVIDHDRDHPGVILCCGSAAQFQLWLPGFVSVRSPDLGVVRKNTPKDERGRRQPVLVAEVVWEGTAERDYVVKREEYLAFGILEYWIVDPRRGKLTFLWRRGDVWGERVIRDAEAIPSLVLPGLAIKIEDLWENVEWENVDPNHRD